MTTHRHTCPECKTAWEHSLADSQGSVEKHRCPNCRHEVWTGTPDKPRTIEQLWDDFERNVITNEPIALQKMLKQVFYAAAHVMLGEILSLGQRGEDAGLIAFELWLQESTRFFKVGAP